ncbi:hypothetical protein NUSPORA_02039 [Nucleospora cyclopteri]
MSTKKENFLPIGSKITHKGNTYELKKLIGRGAYAQCFLVKDQKDGDYALKIVKLSELKGEKIRQKLETEIEIHGQLDHPNIVKMHTSFRTTEYVFILMELCEQGSLDVLLKNNVKLKERYVAKFGIQILKALLYLHDQKDVVHRDLKLGNIFLDRSLNVKLGDFGLAAKIENGERRKTVCGTPNYIAPEVLFKTPGGHSFEADIWSFGVILYSLLIGKPPFQMSTIEEIYKKIQENNFAFPPKSTISLQAADIIMKILVSSPKDRPSLSDILNHQFFSLKESLATRIYKNILYKTFNLTEINEEHVICSFPMDIIKGVGYVLKSGTVGIYYQNLENVYIKANKIVMIKIKMDNGKKIFITEDYPLNTTVSFMKQHRENIKYFIDNFTKYSFASLELPRKSTNPNQDIFVAKIKRIHQGLLFIMTNNIFVFDFNFGEKVVVSSEGQKINVLDDEGIEIEFSEKTNQIVLNELKPYIK